MNYDKTGNFILDSGNNNNCTEIISVREYDRKMLIINIDSRQGEAVRFKVPVKIIKTLLMVTGSIPVMSEVGNIIGVNIDELVYTISNSLDSTVMGELVNITSADGDKLVVLVE